MSTPLVVGVGNPYRHDDGVGTALVERLRAHGLGDVDLVEETGEPVALVERWSARATVVLVDAVSSGATAGSLHRFECTNGEWDALPAATVVSTHTLGVAEAVELGRVLGRLPERLVVLGVEAGDVSDGVGLSPAVAGALDELLRAVLAVVSPAEAEA